MTVSEIRPTFCVGCREHETPEGRCSCAGNYPSCDAYRDLGRSSPCPCWVCAGSNRFAIQIPRGATYGQRMSAKVDIRVRYEQEREAQHARF